MLKARPGTEFGYLQMKIGLLRNDDGRNKIRHELKLCNGVNGGLTNGSTSQQRYEGTYQCTIGQLFENIKGAMKDSSPEYNVIKANCIQFERKLKERFGRKFLTKDEIIAPKISAGEYKDLC